MYGSSSPQIRAKARASSSSMTSLRYQSTNRALWADTCPTHCSSTASSSMWEFTCWSHQWILGVSTFTKKASQDLHPKNIMLRILNPINSPTWRITRSTRRMKSLSRIKTQIKATKAINGVCKLSASNSSKWELIMTFCGLKYMMSSLNLWFLLIAASSHNWRRWIPRVAALSFWVLMFSLMKSWSPGSSRSTCRHHWHVTRLSTLRSNMVFLWMQWTLYAWKSLIEGEKIWIKWNKEPKI